MCVLLPEATDRTPVSTSGDQGFFISGQKHSLIILLAICLLFSILAFGCAGGTDTVPDVDQELSSVDATDAPDDAPDNAEPDEPADPPLVDGDAPIPDESNSTEAEEEAVADDDPGTTSVAEETGPAVTLLVTRDYGGTVLFQREVGLEDGDTVLDILKRNLTVETGYGGGFVNGISGLASGSGGGRRCDWLFWVNGVLSAAGPADFVLRSGDHVWWDYQDWAGASPVPAVIGAFPQPFVSGHRERTEKTVVLYAPGAKASAEMIKRYLERFNLQVVLSAVDEDRLRHREHPTVVVGVWTALGQSPFLEGLNERGRRAGLFVTFEDSELLELGASGKTADRYGPGTGAIAAAGGGPGDRTPLWIVSGVDSDGLAAAVAAFEELPAAPAQAFNMIITAGRGIAVPRTTG